MTRWVLSDYGEVISEPLPAETIRELADLAGQRAGEFRDRYWKFRRLYDLGQSDRAYWSAVLGRDLQAEPHLVEALVRVDIAGWMTLNPQAARYWLPLTRVRGTAGHSVLGPAVKVMVPPSAGPAVAVRVTLWPKVAGLRDEVRVMAGAGRGALITDTVLASPFAT
jgi:hypothetical protein